MSRFRHIEGAFRDACLKWGYEEVRTPTIEYLHLFTAAGTLTPGTLSRVYSFLDWDGWSGERVVLRPDGTIPVARLYIDNFPREKLARLFYITNIFIFEETGKETREKWQCGAELIGVGSAAADVELITLSLEVLKLLGLENIELRLSHAGLIRALLAGFGLSPEEQGKVFDQVLDGDVTVLGRLKEQMPELARLLKPLLDLKGETPGFLRNLKAVFRKNLPEFAPALDNFLSIVARLTAIGQSYRIDVASGRGFEYYTGVIFQLFSDGVKVGGGGRYDALIPLLGGKNIPASGFALYMDPVMRLIPAPPPADGKQVLIRTSTTGAATMRTACELAGDLRQAGFVTIIAINSTEGKSYRWVVEIKAGAPRFTVTDRETKRKSSAGVPAEVIKLLGGRSDNKSRSA